ncbi:hypothetical protein SAMN05518672_104727 [Chitinophaga sp. CF118]|uniref:hypothetical protein n=1 Tax=Chitinophaga sp. CF118 TaxID=1884367 RepID=UPI0008DF3C68|nr:hypothetical protein [Chitinophaga sp. CF118]SFE16552.1 hypothetical protein SAMN05518672_104727 [Chitinophaga sp. CF118]
MKFTKIDNIPSPTHPNNYSVTNKENHIEFKLIDWTDPDQGPMMHIVQFIINGVDRTADYLRDGNKVIFGLTKYQFSDPAGRFCFIPASSSLMLVDTDTLNKMNFGKADFDFVGNIFYGDKHLVVCNDHLIVTDLHTLKSTKFPFEGEPSIEWAYFVNPDLIRIIHYHSNECSLFDLNTGRIIETRSIAREGASAWIVRSYKLEGQKNILEMIWTGGDPTHTAKFLVEE